MFAWVWFCLSTELVAWVWDRLWSEIGPSLIRMAFSCSIGVFSCSISVSLVITQERACCSNSRFRRKLSGTTGHRLLGTQRRQMLCVAAWVWFCLSTEFVVVPLARALIDTPRSCLGASDGDQGADMGFSCSVGVFSSSISVPYLSR